MIVIVKLLAALERRSNYLQTCKIHHQQVKYWRLNSISCIVAILFFGYIGTHYCLFPIEAILQRVPLGFNLDKDPSGHVNPFDV